MNYILFDTAGRQQLLPFTHTRPMADIRCGILSMRERWELCLGEPTGTLTEDYLQKVFPAHSSNDNCYVNGAIFGNAALAAAIQQLQSGQKLVSGNTVIAVRSSEKPGIKEFHKNCIPLPERHFAGEIAELTQAWDIFSLNDWAIREDFAMVTRDRKSASIPEGVMVTGKEHLFIEEGAIIYPGCIINAGTGPVYIGRQTEVLEGAMIRGPLATGDHAVVKMGAKIYGATTIGPGCKVGGEINNVVFFANSNKSHDGYLGNAVIGEWCNLGADTNCSNLKNNYDEIKIWSEAENKLIPSGLTFCGLLMGDHSKCAINTMFNTGTVVGVSCNIFSSGFPEKFVPSFSWGGSEKMTTYAFYKAMETANRMMGRRGIQLSEAEKKMYHYVFELTDEQRIVYAVNNVPKI